MAKRKTDESLIWGGLALAAVVGLVMNQKNKAAAAAAAAPSLLSPYPTVASPAYKPPIMSAPGYTPPVVGAAPPPSTPAPAAPPAAPPIVSAPVVVGPSAAASNAAFDADVAAGRQWQRDTFASQSADLLARVQAGQISPSSPEYRQSFDYLANLTGGVATQNQEAAKLTAAGLPPPA